MGMTQKKILIIDDEAVFREAIINALTGCGYRCVAEENAADGINRLKRESFDLVLLDIMMDPIDGWDTLDHIKTLPRRKNTPVILSSAKKLQADEVVRYGEQVAGFLIKPFIDEDFCEAVSDFFSWHDMLKSDAAAAASQGVPGPICEQWILLSRQIKSISRLKEVISPRCIPEDTLTEEECLAKKMIQIDLLIDSKIHERDELCRKYPVLLNR
jgi:CheY-like chemotaxis protein